MTRREKVPHSYPLAQRNILNNHYAVYHQCPKSTFLGLDINLNIKKTFKKLKNEQIEEVLKLFIGKSEQLPPMFSAIKVNGIRLYKYARKGLTISRKSRQIVVHSICLKNYKEEQVQLEIETKQKGLKWEK